jgi:hypothetical protein
MRKNVLMFKGSNSFWRSCFALLLVSLFSFTGYSQTITVTNTVAIHSDYYSGPFGEPMPNTSLSDCPYEFSIELPENAQVLTVNASYGITAAAGAWMSEQRSFIRVTNEGGGTSPVLEGEGSTAGLFTYNFEGLNIATGLSGTINFEFHLKRTWGGTGCDSGMSPGYQTIAPDGLEVSVVYAIEGECLVPQLLSTSNIGPINANLSWVSLTGDFEVSLGEPGHEAGTGTIISVDEAVSTQLIGLQPSTQYGVYVRALCDGEPSEWSDEHTFTTAVCAVPTNLVAVPSLTSATVAWSSNGALFEVSYGAVGHTPGEGINVLEVSGATSTEITGLTSGETYEVFVRNGCGDSFSGWSSGVTFTTLCEEFTVNLSLPFEEDFEDCVAWQIANGPAPNAWVVGDATANGGSNSIYVSNDGGETNSYNINSNSRVHFYRDFEVPEGLTEIYLSFDWKGNGENNWDYMRVYYAPTTYIPVGDVDGAALPGSIPAQGLVQLKGEGNAGNFQMNGDVWESEVFQLPQDLAGTTFRLIFSWRNDGVIGNQPPAAVDNIMVEAAPTPGKDIQALAAIVPSALCLNIESDLGIRVFNYGTEELDFAINNITYTVNVSGPNGFNESYDLTVTEGVLDSGEELEVVVTGFTPTEAGTYTINAEVDMVGDEIAANNGPTANVSRLVEAIVETPSEVVFNNYTGGNISTLNSDWNSAQGFITRSAIAQETHFGGARTVRNTLWFANTVARIQSPYFEVQEGDVAIFVSALTGNGNGNEPDALITGDSIYVSVISCGGAEPVSIWAATPGDNPLTNNLQPFTLDLDDFVGETIRLEFGARAPLASGGANPVRIVNIHFGEFYIGAPPSCFRPTGLQDAVVPDPDGDGQCMLLSWTPGEEDQVIFELVWGEAGFDPNTDGNVEDVFSFDGDYEFLLCGIPAGLQLEFYVRANCGIGGFSTFEGPRAFFIPPPGSTCEDPVIVTELPYLQTGINTEMYGDNYDQDMLAGTSCTGTGLPSTFYINGNDFVATYTAPVAQTVRVTSFNIIPGGTGAFSWSSLYVMDSCPDDNPSCYNAIGNSGNDPRVIDVFLEADETIYIVVSTWPAPQTVTVDLSIEEISCLEPANLVVVPLSLTDAEVSFNGFDGDEFEVKYGAPGFDVEVEGTVVSGTSSPITVEGLTSGDLYDFYVRRICEDEESVWVGPTAYLAPQLGSSCATPLVVESVPFLTEGVNAGDYGNFHNAAQLNESSSCGSTFYINGDEVVYSFTPAVSGAYEIRSFDFDQNSTALFVMDGCPGEGTTCLAAEGRFDQTPREVLLFLEAGEEYTIIVSKSAAPTFSFSLEINLIECPLPVELSGTPGAVGEVTFSWQGFDGVEFDLIWGEPGFNPEEEGTLVTGITSQTHSISGLEDFNTICAYVRNVCESGATEWVGPACSNILCDDFTINLTEPFEEDFEDCVSWMIVNGEAPNGWFVGEATNNGGDRSIYISNDGGVNNEYDINASAIAHFYRDFSVPEGFGDITLTFDWKGNGEAGWDFMRVYYAPTTYTPVAGTTGNLPVSIPAQGLVQLKGEGNAGNFQMNNTWTSETFTLPEELAGTTVRIIFSWRNDAIIGMQPAMAVDNVGMVANSTVGIVEVGSTGSKLKAFPNPTSGMLNLVADYNAPNSHIEVYDLQGRLVYNKRSNLVAGEPYQLNLGGLAQGMYNIRISTNNSVEFTRIMVK